MIQRSLPFPFYLRSFLVNPSPFIGRPMSLPTPPDGSTPPPDGAKSECTSRVSKRFPTSDSEFEANVNLFKAGVPFIPTQDEEKNSRAGFSSQLQYILAVIGMSVGLGNIWRFPSVAYENGGGAFLIPYLCMGVLFGLPMLYIDSSIGQFMQSSPSIVFKQYFPAAQGLGWAMAMILISIGFIYIVPCTWSFMYIIQLIMGNMNKMSSCSNSWNTPHCESILFCKDTPDTVYFNNSCMPEPERKKSMNDANMDDYLHSAQEEFFNNFINNKHASFSFGDFNWMFAVCLFVCWTLTAIGLLKGVQSMGKVALVTTFLPYIIITILFFRGITLDGAHLGIEYFLTKPDWSKLKDYKTWLAALQQCLFSLSLGCGPMIMMSSYNKRNHPNYRDCIIILCADTFMSFFGGTAVFAILGSMAKKMKKDIDKVVSSPLTLTFIAYPEATSHMPLSTLWALLFFVMMFIIGMSTMFAFVEGLATCIVDEHPKLRKWHGVVVISICAGCFVLNVICFTFQNGYHIFSVFNNFLGTVSLSGTLLLEMLIVMAFYGAPRLFRDIQCMHGLPSTQFGRIFGNLGLFIKIGVTFTAPLLALTMSVVICYQIIGADNSGGDNINNVPFKYPVWTVILGFIAASFPLLLVPLGTYLNYRHFKKTGMPVEDLFRISNDHPSVRYNLPEPVSWRRFLFPPLRAKVAPIPYSIKPMTIKDAPHKDFLPEHAESANPNQSIAQTKD